MNNQILPNRNQLNRATIYRASTGMSHPSPLRRIPQLPRNKPALWEQFIDRIL